MQTEFTKWTRQINKTAELSGTWAKIGKSRYQRVTGEIVEKTLRGWSANGRTYQTKAAAISTVDWGY